MSKFLIKQTDTGIVFHLVARNGETVGTSQVYANKQTCHSGIESVKSNANVHVEDQTKEGYASLTCPKYEVYMDKGGHHFRFRLVAHNGQEILASQAYTTKESCEHGIQSVGTIAGDATIVEEE